MATRPAIPNLPILSDASLLALRREILADLPESQQDLPLGSVLQEIEREIVDRGMVGSPWWAEQAQKTGSRQNGAGGAPSKSSS